MLVMAPVSADEQAGERTMPVQAPVRLADGRPLVPIYFFTHWWQPWRGSDDLVRSDLRRLSEMGVNTLLLDHEWCQRFEAMGRDHALAAETGMKIIPWLSLKTWGDMISPKRRKGTREQYGYALDVPSGPNAGFLPYGPNTINLGVAYTNDYLKRYRNSGALLHVNHNGDSRPVVALTVEASWSYLYAKDAETRLHFCRWLRDRYQSINKLNDTWSTQFADFFDIDPNDAGAFDFKGAVSAKQREVPAPVEDFIRFCAEIVSDAMAAIRQRVRQQHPDVLILAELPYEFASQHPAAWSYVVSNAAVPRMVEYADMVLLRSVGALSAPVRQALIDYRARTGKPVIVTHRISPMQGPGDAQMAHDRAVRLFAHEAAAVSNGLGYYSWNEMVDVHMVANTAASPKDAPCVVTSAQHEQLVRRVADINRRYLQIHEQGLKQVKVPSPVIQSSDRSSPMW